MRCHFPLRAVTPCTTLTLIGMTALFTGCGSSTTVSFESFFPADNQILNWVADTSATAKPSKLEIMTSDSAVYAAIDGDYGDYTGRGLVKFGWKAYIHSISSQNINLRIFQMKDAAVTQKLYEDLLLKRGQSQTFKPFSPTIGDASHVADTINSWLLVARSGVYHLEFRCFPGGESNLTDATAFMKSVVTRLK